MALACLVEISDFWCSYLGPPIFSVLARGRERDESDSQKRVRIHRRTLCSLQERHNELAGMAEEQLRAELEYWHELEALSGQREHFRPGRTDETAYADDEVRTREVAARVTLSRSTVNDRSADHSRSIEMGDPRLRKSRNAAATESHAAPSACILPWTFLTSPVRA